MAQVPAWHINNSVLEIDMCCSSELLLLIRALGPIDYDSYALLLKLVLINVVTCIGSKLLMLQLRLFLCSWVLLNLSLYNIVSQGLLSVCL